MEVNFGGYQYLITKNPMESGGTPLILEDHTPTVLTGLIKIINRRLRCYCDTHNSSHLLCRKCVVICFEPLYFKPLYCPKLDRFLRFSGICHFKPHSVFKKRK